MRTSVLCCTFFLGLAGAVPAQAQDRHSWQMWRSWPGSGGEADSFLGVYLDEVDAEAVEELGLPEERGALVAKVLDETPAAEAGLQDKDVIIQWNQAPVESSRQLKRLVNETPAGRRVALQVVRNRDTVGVEVVIGRHGGHGAGTGRSFMPWDQKRMPFEQWHPPLDMEPWPAHSDLSNRVRLGVMLTPLTDQLGAYFGLENDSGVLIASVLEDTPAAEVGLRAGDVITAVDGRSMDSPSAVQQAIQGADATVTVSVVRDGQPLEFEIELGEPDDGSIEIDLESGTEPEEEGREDVEGDVYPQEAM